jgi:hypothetical protein
MTIQEFKSILKELGFERKKALGTWGYSPKLLPGNDIEVVNFIKGNFWISKGETRVFSNNYKTLDSGLLIEELIKVANNT